VKTSKAEAEILDLILTEIRHANASGEQLSIMVDPWRTPGTDGADLFFSYSETGLTFHVAGAIGGRRRPTEAALISRRSRKKKQRRGRPKAGRGGAQVLNGRPRRRTRP
jgi:hypothetical protein